MTVADIEVERSGAVPAQSLIELEELLDLPSLRIVLGESGNLRTLGSAQEALVVMIFFAAAAALNVLVVKGLGLGLEMVRLNGRGVARPMFCKGSGGNFVPALDRIGISRHSAEQVEELLLAHGGEEFLAIVLLVGEDQGPICRCWRSAQNFGRHVQQFGAGLHHRLRRRAEAKTDRLTGVAIQQEKGLGHFGWLFLGTEAVP